jgi:hypothetical protein
MRDAVFQRLHQEFGAPGSETHQIWCWSLRPGFELILEKNEPADTAVVWIPAFPDDPRIPFAEPYYQEGRTVAATHPCAPSLALDRRVSRIPISSTEELELAILEIRRLSVIPTPPQLGKAPPAR